PTALLRLGSFSQPSLPLPRLDSISSPPCSSTREGRIPCEQATRLCCHCRQRSGLIHHFCGREDCHPGREKHVLRRLPVHCSQKPRSRAGREQGSRLVQGQDSGGDLRRYKGRYRCTHPRDDRGGISFRAEKLTQPCVTILSSRPVQTAPSLQRYLA